MKPGVITRGSDKQALYTFEEAFNEIHRDLFFRRPPSLKPYCTRDCVFCDENVLIELTFSSKANTMLKNLRRNRMGLLTLHAHRHEPPAVMLEIEYAAKCKRGYQLLVTKPHGPRIHHNDPLERKVFPVNMRNTYAEGPKGAVDNKLYEQLEERILEVRHDLRLRRDHHGLTA